MGSCKRREVGFKALSALFVGALATGAVPAHAQDFNLGGLLKGMIDAVDQQEKQQNSGSAPPPNPPVVDESKDWRGRQQSDGSTPSSIEPTNDFANWEAKFDDSDNPNKCKDRAYENTCFRASGKLRGQLCIERAKALPISENSIAELERLNNKCMGKISSNDGDIFWTIVEEKQEKIHKIMVQRVAAERAADKIKKEQLEAERQDAINAATQDHQRKLRSGELKIKSIEDASLFYAPVKDVEEFSIIPGTGGMPKISGIAIYPLLTPDNKIHNGMLILDGEENSSLLRARTSGLITSGVHYVFLKKTRNTIFFHPGNLRIGGRIKIVGRYVANSKYQTVGGEQKIAPVLDALFIE